MNKLLLITIALFSLQIAAQDNLSIEQIYNSYVKGKTPHADKLLKAIDLIGDDCVSTAQYDCDKIKVIAYYKLSEQYYYLAEQVLNVDPSMYKQFETKAIELRKQANTIMPESELDERSLKMLSYSKYEFHYALDRLNN